MMSRPGESVKLLYSGRFDPPHLGHLCTVLRRMEENDIDEMVIVILDYPERVNSPVKVKQAFKEILALTDYSNQVTIQINDTHFGEITKEELMGYGCDVYLAGNDKVLTHVNNLGCIKVIAIDEPYGFHSSASSVYTGEKTQKH